MSFWHLDSVGAVGGRYPVYAYSAAFKMCLLALFAALIAGTLVKETISKKSIAS